VSGEKIDLAVVVARAEYELKNGRPSEFAEDVLALVAAVRAARACCEHLGDQSREQYERQKALHAALSPFTDSAEDK
jgi:hypothetical protein